MTDTMIAETTTASVPGFIGRARYRRVECDWLAPEDGAPKLFAEVRADLPFGVLRSMPYGGDATYAELWAFLARHHTVRSWNAMAVDMETGEYAPAPSPAEAGADAFAFVDPIISDWLAFVVKTTYQNIVSDDQKKVSSGSPSSPSGGDSASSVPAKPSRPRRATST